MAISCETDDGVAVAVLSGRLDGFTAPDLQAALEKSLENPAVRFAVMDMGAVHYLSSAGIRVFLTAHRRLSARHGSLVLAGVRDYCAEVINLTGFHETWPAFDSLAAAKEYCWERLGAGVPWAACEKRASNAGDLWIRPSPGS